MSKAGLFLHTTINFDEVAAALDYGQRTLDHATYAKVTNAFKKMHFLFGSIRLMAKNGMLL